MSSMVLNETSTPQADLWDTRSALTGDQLAGYVRGDPRNSSSTSCSSRSRRASENPSVGSSWLRQNPGCPASHRSERQRVRAKDDAVLMGEDVVGRTGVVETRLDGDLELHAAANGDDPPDEPVAVVGRPGRGDRHEVLDLAHTLLREKARDEDVRVR